MRKFARIENNKVAEIVEADDIAGKFHESLVFVDITDISPQPSEHWVFDGATFAPPSGPSLTAVKSKLISGIDNYIGGVYSKFTRFEAEYTQREVTARAFVAAGYTGDAGPWVMGYATPAGKTASQAADTIILQADALRAALVTLGGLRMRKYEIADAIDAAAAQVTYDDIITNVDAVVATLG